MFYYNGVIMKCPKCKYVAFDYLDTCPRCGKDVSEEKAKLNISSIKPNPPFLLGSLTGDLNDSGVDIKVAESTQEGAGDMKLKGEEIYDDGSELDIDMEKEDISESSEDTDLGGLGLSDDDKGLEMDLALDDMTAEGGVKEEEVKEAGSGLEEGADQEGVQGEETGEVSEEIDLDLEDLKLDLDEDEDSKG
jgi:hypothetical protein